MKGQIIYTITHTLWMSDKKQRSERESEREREDTNKEELIIVSNGVWGVDRAYLYKHLHKQAPMMLCCQQDSTQPLFLAVSHFVSHYLSLSPFAVSVFHFALSKCPAHFNMTLIKCELVFYTINIFYTDMDRVNFTCPYVNCHTRHFYWMQVECRINECKINAAMDCVMFTILKPALNGNLCMSVPLCSKFRTICMKMSTLMGAI